MTRPRPAPRVTRREFSRAGSAVVAAAAGTALARSVHAAGSDRLKIGLVGCGGRGLGAGAQAMNAEAGVVLWALADPFPDRITAALDVLGKEVDQKAATDQAFRQRFDCPPERRFTGLDGYRQVIECCDVVLLASPPAFRAAHLRAAVEAGRHVFCEKPVAVDATALRHARESLDIARGKRLSVVSGFNWRYAARMRDAFKRIADGAIGEVRSAFTTYNAPGYGGERPRQPGWTDMEYQIRNWHHYTWLSGDHVVEQAIHSVDRLLWAFGDELPTRVLCTGGREMRPDRPEGNNIFDHFVAAFEFSGGRRGFHMCRHFANCPFDNTDYVTGTTGTGEIDGWHDQRLFTPTGAWSSGEPRNNMYQQEHDDLLASIRRSRPIDDGHVLVNAAAAAIMARMSGYTGQPVSLEQLWASQENLAPDPLALDAPPPATPIAVPGKTKLV